MSKSDAERAMDIYRAFARQTEFVVAYLNMARRHEHHTRVEVPKLKHAPVNLGKKLDEYLRDPDFEINRRQYLAEQGIKKNGGLGGLSKKTAPEKELDLSFPEPASNNPFPRSNGASSSKPAAEVQPQANKGPDPDLIDFFESIEQNQTTMPVNPQQTGAPVQQNAFQTQPTGMQIQTSGFAPQPAGFAQNNAAFQQNMGAFPQQQQPAPQPLQPNFTGAGFGGFTPQPSFQPSTLGSIPQDSVPNFQMGQQPMQTGSPASLQPMQTGTTNPFRQSMLMQQQTAMPMPMPAGSNSNSPAPFSPIKRQSTNPFARASQNNSPLSSNSPSPFQPQQQMPQQMPPAPAPLQPTATGTNPFARNTVQSPPAGQEQRPQTAGAIAPQPTGTTNPFRQGAFVNHATGMGWQHNQMPIGGGIDQLQTQPVFPRPAQQTPWQQQ
jgi:hypothetical protein